MHASLLCFGEIERPHLLGALVHVSACPEHPERLGLVLAARGVQGLRAARGRRLLGPLPQVREHRLVHVRRVEPHLDPAVAFGKQRP